MIGARCLYGACQYQSRDVCVAFLRHHTGPREGCITNKKDNAAWREIEKFSLTYGPYFDALRAEYRKKAREILEARERTEEYAVLAT